MSKTSKSISLPPKTRHQDQGLSIYDFGHDFLVRCPQCKRCAEVTIKGVNPLQPSAVRLVCGHCGYSKQVQQDVIQTTWRKGRYRMDYAIGGAYDWYFKTPLWLRTPCAGHELWANNADHLEFLEEYVRASIREDSANRLRAIRNSSLASRLPGWIKSAKNRDKLDQGLKKLRGLLKSTTRGPSRNPGQTPR